MRPFVRSSVLLIILAHIFCAPLLAAPTTVKALVIGNSRYASWPQLPGAARDAQTFRTVLLERFKVAAQAIRLVEDARREDIEAAMDQFIASLSGGDTAVFYYAGHGAVCLDETGTDPNGLNECIVGIDAPTYEKADFAAHVVRNVYFEQAIARLKQRVRSDGRQGHVLLVFDSCHSGSISRGSDGRFRSARGIRDFFMKQAHPSGRPRAVQHAAGQDGWVLLAACRAEEEASDDKSFTQYLAAVLQSSNLGPQSDYVDLMQQIGTTELMMYQSPQAEGELDVPLLGGTAVPRPPACYVRKSYSGYVELDQGTLVGFTPRSRIALYRAGTHSPHETKNKIAEAVIEEDDAGPFKVTAHVEGTPQESLRGAVAFVTDQVFADAAVRMYLSRELPAPVATLLRGLCGDAWKSSVELVATADQAHVLVVPARAGAVALQRLSAAGGVQATLFEGMPTEVATMSRIIKQEARRRALMTLVTGDDLALAVTPGRFTLDHGAVTGFNVETGDAARARAQHLQGTALTFKDGDQAELAVTNHAASPLYVTVLYFNARGGIDVIYPAPAQEANWAMLEPGRTLKVPTGFSLDRDQRGQGDLLEAFKIIGTREKINTDFLRTRGSAPRNPLEQLLGDAAVGHGRRGAGQIGVTTDQGFSMGAPVWVRIRP